MIKELMELVKTTRGIATDKRTAENITVKGAADFVTETDKAIQAFLKPRLAEMYPDVAFMSEEQDNSGVDFTGRVWVLDPIDGTTNLIHDFGMSAVSLGLLDKGSPVLGVVYNPWTDETFTAKRGEGAFLDGVPIRVSGAESLGESLICVGTSPYDKNLADKNFELIKAFFKKSEDVRRCGSAALDLCYAACGRSDGYFERNLKPWDFCAGAAILTEAGGKVTDFNGNAPDYTKNCDILASNGLIHKEMLGIIAG